MRDCWNTKGSGDAVKEVICWKLDPSDTYGDWTTIGQ